MVIKQKTWRKKFVKLEEKISSEKRCTNSKKDGVKSEKVVKKHKAQAG